MSIYSIYKATNKINGKSYIGFDSNWPNRKTTHWHKYKKYNSKFYFSIRKHGWNNFEWSVIYQSKDIKHCLNEMESYFIKEFDSYNNGYNMTFGGEAVMLNRTHSTESKIKMANSKIGKKLSPEHLKQQTKKLNEYYNKNGSRIEKNCLVCKNSFISAKHKNQLTCNKSCAATHRNLNRNYLS